VDQDMPVQDRPAGCMA